jgi:nitroreductase
VGTIGRWLRRIRRQAPENVSRVDDLHSLSTDQLLALMRHEAHRIEKTIYNDILEKKFPIYQRKWVRVGEILELLRSRGLPADEPTMAWARDIHQAFDALDDRFIKPRSTPGEPIDDGAVGRFVELVKRRRSVRVWAELQPDRHRLEALARELIDAARWAPTSGNRQPWRFKVLVDPEKKELLRGLKEGHCIAAPLLVFVGMDTRLYGALGAEERGVYIDAGAAVMQMVLAAHSAGYGVCWNHFADDLIRSRASNVEAYRRFSAALGIALHIAPIAVVAVGRPAFIPPVPARMNIDDLLIPDPD